jgi:DNA-binding transcriptional ArsR family regulator
VLKEAGLVTDRREGRWVYYTLNRGAVEDLSALLTDCCTPQRGWLRGSCCGPSAH